MKQSGVIEAVPAHQTPQPLQSLELHRAASILNRRGEVLHLTESAIKRVARLKLGRSNIAMIFLKQAFYERWVRLRTHLSFRSRENSGAVKAYSAMTGREFEGINARQRWANWRTIARNLNGHLPNRPLRAIDLCCGVGHSTEVLAYYLAPGSEILGLEYNPRFVELARTHRYLDEFGDISTRVHFRAQSVLETFIDTAGNPVDARSVDLVNSCGAVGCHFDSNATTKLAREIARVMKPGGLALIDSGDAGTNRKELGRIFDEFGFDEIGAANSCVFDLYVQVCFRKR